MSPSDWYWIGFGLAFAGGELLLFLCEGEAGTLTAKLRQILGIQPRKPWIFLGVPAVVLFGAWLFAHLVLGF